MSWLQRKPHPVPSPRPPDGVYITVEVISHDMYANIYCPESIKQQVYDLIMAENHKWVQERISATLRADAAEGVEA